MFNVHPGKAPLKERRASAGRSDLWTLALLTLVTLVFLVTFDIYEELLKSPGPHTGFPWDEIVLVLYLMPIGLSWYAFRRSRESQSALERLQCAEAQISQLCASNAAVIYTCKVDGNYAATFISPNVKQLVGIPPENFLKSSDFWNIRVHPDDIKGVLNALKGVILTGSQTHEHRLRTPDGSFVWVRNDLSLIYDEHGLPKEIIGAWTDISESKKAENKVHEAEQKVAIANCAKSHLMANMSHELRTPLNAIIGFSYTILKGTFGPIGNRKYQEYLNDINHSGKHLLDLINDILDVSSLESSSLTLYESQVSLSKVIESSVRIIKSRAEQGCITISTTINTTLPLIYVDEPRIKQIVLHLLSNAVKFTAPGGKVSITSKLNDDGSLAVTISDTGIGMNDTEITMALSTFGQVDSGLNRKYGGTGLGLPLTKGLIERHGGTLDIKSKKDQGTLITVTLPPDRVGQYS